MAILYCGELWRQAVYLTEGKGGGWECAVRQMFVEGLTASACGVGCERVCRLPDRREGWRPGECERR
jgi:hypothetical protein